MKIWIVLAADIGGSDMQIYGLFSSEEKAERALKMLSGNDHACCPADLAIDCMDLDKVAWPVPWPKQKEWVAI